MPSTWNPTDRGLAASRWRMSLLVLLSAVALAGEVEAIETPEATQLRSKELRVPGLTIETALLRPTDLEAGISRQAVKDLEALRAPAGSARIDVRSGRWASLAPTTALLPGRGVGNELSWTDLGRRAPESDDELKAAAEASLRRWLADNSEALRIDPAGLAGPMRVTSHDAGRIVQVYQQRTVGGVPVRGSFMTATFNSGNLVLFGTERWGDIDVATTPTLDRDEALAKVQSHVGAFAISGEREKSELQLIPMAVGLDLQRVGFGAGYEHRLAWVVRPTFESETGRWEALVDAHSGELLAFEDTNHYATSREVVGGVYPVTNDGIVPDGVEQGGWPMPFVDVSSGGETLLTDAGGSLLECVDGDITSTLSGAYVRINDDCGAIGLTGSGDLDFGTSGGDDCVTPGFGGAGNTHSARSGFHELNRMIEMARSHLPENAWLQQQLTANMNINNTCNAFWGGGTVNFYRSGGGCANTGEIAGVFDHEWGHGMDDNDTVPSIASPSGEGIADIYAALRLNTSCIGRNFRTTNCGGFGDPCTECTGVRDIDWAKRLSGTPHTYTWTNANCSGSVHCIGATYAEAVWDLWKRDLPALHGMDDNTAHEVVNRLTFIGGGNVGTWFDGGPPFGGCAATSGYKQYLAADDDNGNLNDGTPHMTAIYNAFNRLEIACDDLTVQDAGCAGTPAAAPVVAVTPLDRGAALSWGAVAGASTYEIFRTDGVFACDFGKIKVGETTGTSWVDSGLQNGRTYSYVVIAKGTAASCFGPASACASVVPASGANMAIASATAGFSTTGGDGDSFVDNCEQAALTFDITNIGDGGLTNVRITDVRVVSHPATAVAGVSVVPSDVTKCQTATGTVHFTPAGLSTGDRLSVEVDVTSDELSPIVRTQTFSLANTESDTDFRALRTWVFETGLNGWTVVQGTMEHAASGGGAGGSAGYVSSSTGLGDQCDQIRSPAFRPTATTTVTAWTNFDIEAESDQWYDQANLGLVTNGVRTIVDPDSGRAYSSDGAGASCVTRGGNGWAGAAPTWASSGWSAAALGSAGLAGQVTQLDMAYGTDPLEHPRSFWFDQVRVTDIELLVDDQQADACGCSPVVLDNTTISGSVAHHSCSTLTVGPSVIITSGVVELRGADAVVFVDGTIVESSASLEVQNGAPDL